MTITTQAPLQPNDDVEAAATSFEGEIREFVRRDFTPVRRPDTGSGEFAASNISTLVQRVAGTSLAEIENLIGELQTLRDYIASEGERVQRELAGYAQLNQAAMASTRIIAESMSKWKTHVDSSVDDTKTA
ncbi:hypothetical protein PQJ75_13215 [Rhodoplanes sp. TEM]|uniref:Phasin domain-containing protein n=1 Tax=Rhodoplanes tepidamans TaxID=200616 RepID=A0ABT5JBC5_RHOTP|nr:MULTISPECIES: hypothetical protein [Rhodoplanes]MDC7786350.1 hypothetical protein [Rhodoplanes tepidamans]MDC7984691.1 hypothetical protein [Rhodoplanes sp. TEM]MDQ0354094.1 hypothetical protein [Rhodoplanes tepidamans]